MNLTKDQIHNAIVTYSNMLDQRVRHASDGTIVGAVGDICKLRRDLIELRLMLRDAENKEWREMEKDELENR